MVVLGLGTQAVAIACVSLAAPLFALEVGPARAAAEILAIGVVLMAIGWVVLPAPKISPAFPITLLACSWGLGLSLGTLRGNDLSELTVRNWLAVVAGAGAVGTTLGVLHLRTKKLTPPKAFVVQLLAALRGEHTYDRSARAWNWVTIWLWGFGAPVAGGLTEAWLRGWEEIHATPVVALSFICGLMGGAVSIRTFNDTRYRFNAEEIERLVPWPRRSWKLSQRRIESAWYEPSHGHWILVLEVRGSRRRIRIPMTTSMRDALELP